MSLLPRILLLDDSADDRELVSLVLRGAFGEVAIEEIHGAAALAVAVSSGRFGAVLTEHELSWIGARDVLRLIRDLRPDCPVLVVTRRPIEDVATELVHLAPDGLIPKSSTGWVGLPSALRTALFLARRRAARDGGEAPARRLLDNLPCGIFVASLQGTLLDANPTLATLLGYTAAHDCAHRPLAQLFASPADADELLARLATAEGPVTMEVRLRRADGGVTSGRLRAWRAPPDAGAGELIQGMVEEREAATAVGGALPGTPGARSTAELDEMAYAISHDLRQPLNQVIRLLELLDQEAGTGLAGDAGTLLGQARASAQRLDGMVDAVLRCARIESGSDAFVPVDLGQVLERVLERLAPERVSTAAKVTHGHLPTVEGDEAQLEQLLQNLLDNALKFHGRAHPRVHVDAGDEGALWHLTVRDHGIGLAPQDAERIFGMFQRLHTAAEAPGSGIGLALCRRIVARHGGRIWVESTPGRGATFHFTLPKRHSTAGDTSKD